MCYTTQKQHKGMGVAMAGLTVALLGIEHPHSLAHLTTLQLLPEVDKILLWDTNSEALAHVRATQGRKVAALFTDLDTLLAQPDLLACVAALRNDLGPDIFMRTLEAGKHLLAEKPIGRSAGDTARRHRGGPAPGGDAHRLLPKSLQPLGAGCARLCPAGVVGAADLG